MICKPTVRIVWRQRRREQGGQGHDGKNGNPADAREVNCFHRKP